jgi:hypothetical protein
MEVKAHGAEQMKGRVDQSAGGRSDFTISQIGGLTVNILKREV